MQLDDRHWMTRALALAERGRGYVEPNPLVGAVVVRDGALVGEGWHERFGAAHAEVNALAEVGDAAHGATLYVTLEPCCHHGKTPPCTDAVVRSGVRRVVAAMADPFPKVAGQGFARLREAGVDFEVGLCEAEARRLNAPYLTLLGQNRPYVHAKWAMTLDGKIATRTGDSKWITCETSRQRVHALRGRMDAIIVGIGTVLADDPLLTARPPGPRVPVRVVLDSRVRLAIASELVRTVNEAPVMIVTAGGLSPEIVGPLRSLGCEWLELAETLEDPPLTPSPSPQRGEGSQGCGNSPWIVRPSIPALLRELGRRRMTNVLVEGGSEVLGSFVDADAIDEFHVFIAPRLVGGNNAIGPVGGRGVDKIAAALTIAKWEVEQIGDDVLLHGWRSRVR